MDTMNTLETLRNARNLLLKLHKTMLDRERESYESLHGPLTATEFLSLLLEDPDFSWLRKFSMLIVEIDELFAQKDGYEIEMVEASLGKVRELVQMVEPDEYFRAKYEFAIQNVPEAASLHFEIKTLLQG